MLSPTCASFQLKATEVYCSRTRRDIPLNLPIKKIGRASIMFRFLKSKDISAKTPRCRDILSFPGGPASPERGTISPSGVVELILAEPGFLFSSGIITKMGKQTMRAHIPMVIGSQIETLLVHPDIGGPMSSVRMKYEKR
jgi:hypothetical protein